MSLVPCEWTLNSTGLNLLAVVLFCGCGYIDIMAPEPVLRVVRALFRRTRDTGQAGMSTGSIGASWLAENFKSKSKKINGCNSSGRRI